MTSWKLDPKDFPLLGVHPPFSAVKNPVIGCLGLGFNTNIDDLRESPAMEITRELIASGVGCVSNTLVYGKK